MATISVRVSMFTMDLCVKTVNVLTDCVLMTSASVRQDTQVAIIKFAKKMLI